MDKSTSTGRHIHLADVPQLLAHAGAATLLLRTGGAWSLMSSMAAQPVIIDQARWNREL